MMGILSSESLVALIWASAALATPFDAEGILSHDLQIRQQQDGTCPDGYTTKNGMSFTTYCEKNNPHNDALAPFAIGSMQECMERCSRYAGEGEGCYGVVWRKSDEQCWLRNSTTGTANIVDLAGVYSALVADDGMEPLDTNCPESDLSTHTLGQIGYTVHCDKDIGGFDTCWSGNPSCLQSPFTGFHHATSLEECLQVCIEEHPLCRGVAYNPGLELGFANCWPKTGFLETLQPPSKGKGVMHAVTITSIDRIETSCPSQTSYTAQGDKHFEIHCGQVNGGTNITSVHTSNITACLDTCATNDQGCIGVVFDSTLLGGYNNCYLQNTTSIISDQAQATYAAITDAPVPSSSSTSSPGNSGSNSNSDSGSKAWIAGPVIGGIALIALIAFAVFWWRRKKSQTPGINPNEKSSGYGAAPAYTPYSGGPAAYHTPNAPPSELGGDYASELATVEYKPSTTTYAHKRDASGGIPSHAPQELPT